MDRRSLLEEAALVEGGRRLEELCSPRPPKRPIAGRDSHPCEDSSTFDLAASLRSFNLLSQLLDEEQRADLFEFGFAIESTPDATLVLDLTGAGVLALEDERLVEFCVDPAVEIPRLDRLTTKLVWARGDWKAFRSEAVPLRCIDLEEMETRLVGIGTGCGLVANPLSVASIALPSDVVAPTRRSRIRSGGSHERTFRLSSRRGRHRRVGLARRLLVAARVRERDRQRTLE